MPNTSASILVVEDDAFTLALLRFVLERQGLQVQTVADGPAALACIAQGPVPDAVLLDLLLRLDAFDPDEVEAESSEGVIKLSFADGSKCVLNRQSAANQMWLAEGATAWHFEFDAASSSWLDTKGRGELRAPGR